MQSQLLWLSAIGPLGLAAVAAAPRALADRHPARMAWLAQRAAIWSLAVALGAASIVVASGASATPTLGLGGIGFGLYVDAVSATMLVLVSFIGMIVVKYSDHYLRGDPRQGRFVCQLSAALAAVLYLILSGNLLQFSLAWIACSLGLHGLLIFYRDRPAAVLAARKKFLISRLGDLSLLMAMALIYQSCGTLDYSLIFDGAREQRSSGALPAGLHAAALLLVITALLKSAQFPFHGWLLEVMETPTPVSALLHAGIINAGGFLVLRFAPLISLSIPALDTLAVIGGITALLGSLVMLPQTSIKVSLAYSTIAQMGFMMLECGLGVFPAALLHIVGHSLYKAHAFLSSGSVIDIYRASWSPSPGGKPHPARLVLAMAIVGGALVAVGALLGLTPANQPGVMALGMILLLGLIHLVAAGFDERPNAYVMGRTIGLASLVALAYCILQIGAERLFASQLPVSEARGGAVDLAILACVVLSFAGVTILQNLLPGPAGHPAWKALYVHITNGFYVNTLANRWILLLWPGQAPGRTSLLQTGA